MLRGRESLVRLVGKRRRFLPNRLAILSSSLESTLNLCSNDHFNALPVETNLDAHDDEDIGTSSSRKYVTCPVCSSRVNGEDSIINSHLDACLSRGTKRKLTQSTLLQLNFYSRSKVQHQSHVLKSEKNECSVGPGAGLMHNTVRKFPEDASCIENDEIICESLVECAMQPQKDCLLDTLNNCERANDASEICSQKKRITSGKAPAKDDLSGMILQTFIVGRKYSDKKELSLGESISLERDPTNGKDPNAIKTFARHLTLVTGQLPAPVVREAQTPNKSRVKLADTDADANANTAWVHLLSANRPSLHKFPGDFRPVLATLR